MWEQFSNTRREFEPGTFHRDEYAAMGRELLAKTLFVDHTFHAHLLKKSGRYTVKSPKQPFYDLSAELWRPTRSLIQTLQSWRSQAPSVSNFKVVTPCKGLMNFLLLLYWFLARHETFQYISPSAGWAAFLLAIISFFKAIRALSIELLAFHPLRVAFFEKLTVPSGPTQGRLTFDTNLIAGG